MPLQQYNDHTRMSRAQLAERIKQMEATAARNSTVGSPNERHRPMEDRRRREKIAIYTEELRRRELRDEYERAAQAQADAQAKDDADRSRRQSARDTARNARTVCPPLRTLGKPCPVCHAPKQTPCHPPTRHCSHQQTSGAQCGAVAIADLDTDYPLCALHGAQAAAARYRVDVDAHPDECPLCDGTGSIRLQSESYTARRCPDCQGSGLRPAPTPVRHDDEACTCSMSGDTRDPRGCYLHDASSVPEPAELPQAQASTEAEECPITDEADPLTVACPTCGAHVAQRCRRPSGHRGPIIQHHAARRKLAAQLATDSPRPAPTPEPETAAPIATPPTPAPIAAAAAEPDPCNGQDLPHPPPTPIAAGAAKLAARLAVPCPQCHAAPGARCTNYRGSHCAPHGARKAPAQAKADIAQAQADAQAATADRRRVVATARAATIAELAAELAPLIAQHDKPALTEAAWIMAARIHPRHPQPAYADDPLPQDLEEALTPLLRLNTLPRVLDALSRKEQRS